MTLLTFHSADVGRLRPLVAGLALDTHFLLQNALETGVVTVDPAYAGDRPSFGVRFDDAARHEGEVWIVYTDVPPVVTADVQTEYPDNFNELDEHEQEAFPSTLPAPSDRAACLEWLVGEINSLHSRTLHLAAHLTAKADR